MWFWFVFMIVVNTLHTFYRVSTLFFDKLRFYQLFKTVRHKYDEDVTKCLEYVLSKCQVADWFVMYQLSKNCNQYFFREFIRELAIELKLRPKKSKSRGSVGNGTLRRDNLTTNMGLATLKSADKAQERLINMFKGDAETGSRIGDQGSDEKSEVQKMEKYPDYWKEE